MVVLCSTPVPLPTTRRRATGYNPPLMPRSRTLTPSSLLSLRVPTLGTARLRFPRGSPYPLNNNNNSNRSLTRECPPVRSLRAAPSPPSRPAPCPTTPTRSSRRPRLASSPPTRTPDRPRGPSPETPSPRCTSPLALPPPCRRVLVAAAVVRTSGALLTRTNNHPCRPARPPWPTRSRGSLKGCRRSAGARAFQGLIQ